MRVLFTSLFFGLVAILTLISHPPVEAISETFGHVPQAPEIPATAKSPPSAPTGIIPVSPTPDEQPSDLANQPVTIPEPIAVPKIEIAEESIPEQPLVAEEEILVTSPEDIATAPEAIAPSEPEPSEEETTPPTLEIADTPENRRFIRSLNLHAVYFKPSETDLPQNALSGIAKVAKRLTDLPEGLTVIIGGHTDAHSEEAEAPEIGIHRASVVLDALVAAGAPAERLHLAHYPTAAKRPNASDAWRDRRVEFHLLPPT